MRARQRSAKFWGLLIAITFTAHTVLAQFSGNVLGTIQDPSGAAIPNATVVLLNKGTHVAVTTTSASGGNYRFVSLPPGDYQITAEAPGFTKAAINVTLQTDQVLDLPISMTVAGSATTVEVTGEAPLLNTAESRNQLTLETQALSSLPLAGRNMINLVTLAPGASGLGTTTAGSPGSGVDNYSTETQVDVSANGQGSVANMYVVDGLDITSAIRPGVLNLTPNPDSVQETSIQTNTFTVDYGRASSIQMVLTTKSGTDAFHGTASDYFSYQKFWAGTEFVHNYAPYHSNNISATIGGPIIPHHQFFFFFAIEPLRASFATGNGITTFEDQAFANWAKANFPNTLGTKILTSYPASNGTITGVSRTAAQIFPGTCGTAATFNIPCNLPMIDSGIFNGTNFRNGTQFNTRIDKYFKNDRAYANVYRTVLDTGGPQIRPAFTTTSHYIMNAVQANETHTFSPATVNEASFGYIRTEGISPQTGLFSVPLINVTGQGTGFGNGFAAGDFIQHNYHWRDVLTHIAGAHTMKFGYDGWFGDDVENFQGPHAQPTFAFNNLLDLVQDKPFTETGVSYDPLAGKFVLWDWNAASITHGFFAQDTWKARRNLTLTGGVRFDDFGNPYSRSANTAFGNFYLGQGSTFYERVANGKAMRKDHVFNGDQTAWTPRLGVAWDISGQGKWVIRGGAGMFHNWVTPANAQEEFRGNPPGPIYPTFFAGTANPPLFVLGTSNKAPFGFTYPAIPSGGLDAHGGIVGLRPGIGAIDPNLKTPVTYIYTVSLEHSIARNVVAAIGYSGSRATNLLSGGGQQFSVSYGQDINSYPGDLIQNNSTVPTRLNPSFGNIFYTANDRDSRFNAVVLSVRGRFGRSGFVSASYQHASSWDDTQVYPSQSNPHRYWGPSVWDIPNRFSLSWSYEIIGLNGGNGWTGRLSSWTLSGNTILQSGYPFTITTNASFQPLKDASGKFIGYAPGSGDFAASGNNLAYPNVTSYSTSTNRQAYLHGLIPSTSYSIPAFGTQGNELFNRFRGPGFAQSDVSVAKNISIVERLKLQIRFEFFNVFNRVNLGQVNSNLASATFGRSTTQFNPRWMQIGAKITF